MEGLVIAIPALLLDYVKFPTLLVVLWHSSLGIEAIFCALIVTNYKSKDDSFLGVF